jgi:uncharacterized cupin superfamily protein
MRMETPIGHIAQTPTTTPQPAVKPELVRGMREARLGRPLGITQFGVNHVTLEPGAASALRHWHAGEDEFVYVLSGELTLVDDNGAHALTAGAYAAFPAGVANAHHLVNRSAAPASFLAIGTRKPGEETIHYPDETFGSVRIVRDAKGDRVAD